MTASQRRLLAEDCLACNRVTFQSMCELCADMEQAEETATERTPDYEYPEE